MFLGKHLHLFSLKPLEKKPMVYSFADYRMQATEEQTEERKDTLCCKQSFLKLLDHMNLSNAGTAKLCSPKSQDIRTLGFMAM